MAKNHWTPAPETILLIRPIPDNNCYRARDCDTQREATLMLYPDEDIALIVLNNIQFFYIGRMFRGLTMLAKTGHSALPLVMLGRIQLTDVIG